MYFKLVHKSGNHLKMGVVFKEETHSLLTMKPTLARVIEQPGLLPAAENPPNPEKASLHL